LTEFFTNQLFVYGSILTLAAILSFVFNKWLLTRSANLGFTNSNENRLIRWTSETKPLVGGISFFLLFTIGFIAATVISGEDILANPSYIGLYVSVALAFLIGLTDDVYELNPFLKLMGQLVCANILYFSGIFIEISSLTEINYVISLLWVVGMMNSINMLDNMDGITGITSTGVVITTLIIMVISGVISPFYFILMAGVIGSLIGFLKLNWNPAKVYMGDAGSQFLGAFLSAVSMLYIWNIYGASNGQIIRWSQFALPLIVFILPIIDTITVSIRRIARGQSPFVGGRDHTTHNLAIWGLKDYQVGLTFVAISVISSLLAIWIYGNMILQPIGCTLLALTYFLLLFGGIQMIYQLNQKKADIAKPSTTKIKPIQVALQRIEGGVGSRSVVKDKSAV